MVSPSCPEAEGERGKRNAGFRDWSLAAGADGADGVPASGASDCWVVGSGWNAVSLNGGGARNGVLVVLCVAGFGVSVVAVVAICRCGIWDADGGDSGTSCDEVRIGSGSVLFPRCVDGVSTSSEMRRLFVLSVGVPNNISKSASMSHFPRGVSLPASAPKE